MSRSNSCRASRMPGASARILRESMYAHFGALCAIAGVTPATSAAAARRMPWNVRIVLSLFSLESLPTKLEVELPARRGLVEAVGEVEPERTERRHDRQAHARTPEQARRIDLAHVAPHVTRVVEERQREVVVEAHGVLGTQLEERVAEPLIGGNPARLIIVPAARRVTARGDLRLPVPAQRFAELHATHP